MKDELNDWHLCRGPSADALEHAPAPDRTEASAEQPLEGEQDGEALCGMLVDSLERLLEDTNGRVDLDAWIEAAKPLVGVESWDSFETRARNAWLYYWAFGPERAA